MKAIDIILELLPIPVITGFAVICGTAWLIKELSAFKSYGPVLKSSKFRRIVVLVSVVVIAYGAYTYFRDTEHWRFPETTEGVVVAAFKNDASQDVQIHVTESLKNHLAAFAGTVAIEDDATIVDNSAGARRLMEQRRARVVVWGSYVAGAKVVHAVISERERDDARLMTPDFPNIDAIVTAVRGIVAPGAEVVAINQKMIAKTKYPSRATRGLSIGIDQTASLPPLAYAQKNASAFAKTAGLDKVLLGATKTEVLSELAALKNTTPEDQIWIYFSGVTVRADSKSYLLLADSDPAAPAQTGIALEELTGELPAKQVFVVLDSCCGDAPAKEGRSILAASRAGEPIFETAEHQSTYFTHALLEGLSGTADLDRSGTIDAAEVHTYVSEKVLDASRGRQHPTLLDGAETNYPLMGR
jgi:hypothetical protein